MEMGLGWFSSFSFQNLMAEMRQIQIVLIILPASHDLRNPKIELQRRKYTL
jgi:hypothetical protein